MPVDYLSKIFGASPVKPLQEHMDVVTSCVGELVKFFEAVVADDWDNAAKLQDAIDKLENKADDLKHELRLNLPHSLFMPVSRHDILDLLATQDKIANKAKDIAGLMLGRRMTIPDHLVEPLLQLVRRCHEATIQADTTVNELDELFETGFRGAEVKVVQEMIEELDRIENDTDSLQVKLRGELLKVEQEFPPIDVMFGYKVIEWVGDLADQAQRVGSRLQLLLAR